MALVTITGNVWDHNRAPIPAEKQPELWFRPFASTLAAGLFTGREVKATLTVASGAFTVQLESYPGALYMPVLRWLVNPADSDPERRAFGYDEWPLFYPGTGGPIDSLPPVAKLNGLLYGFGNPPSSLDDVVYLDITGPTVRIWGPANSFVEV